MVFRFSDAGSLLAGAAGSTRQELSQTEEKARPVESEIDGKRSWKRSWKLFKPQDFCLFCPSPFRVWIGWTGDDVTRPRTFA